MWIPVLLLAALAGLAQEPPRAPEQQGSVFRSTSRLIHVNVLVQDKQGRPVAGLRKEDFSLQDNRKAQRIDVFSVETHDKPRVPPAPLPPNVFSNRLEYRGDVPNSVTIVLLNGLNTLRGDQMIAAGDVVAFLRQIQPGDRVALFVLGRSLRMLHDYTSDSSALVRSLAPGRARPIR